MGAELDERQLTGHFVTNRIDRDTESPDDLTADRCDEEGRAIVCHKRREFGGPVNQAGGRGCDAGGVGSGIRGSRSSRIAVW